MNYKREIDLLVLSDLHLGTYGCHAKELLQYLKSITTQTLVLNGDIIDIWNFSKRYFPKHHMDILREIMKMASHGTKVYYITGNHDELLRKYSDLQLGNVEILDKLVLDINHKRYWFFHGDVFDHSTKGSAKFLAKLGGKGYDLLILLNRLINWSLKQFGKPKMSFSKMIKDSVKKAVQYINDFESIIAELAIQKKYDYVICGHIHKPIIKTITTDTGSVIYMNSGDWVENLSALEYSHKKWSLYYYQTKHYNQIQLKNQRQEEQADLTQKILA